MIDVKKLHNAINELENHSATLARVAGLYDKLEKFKTELDILHNIVSKNVGLFRETKADMLISAENLKSQLEKMPAELNALRTEIDKGNAAMRQEIDTHLEAFAVDLKSALGTLLNDMQSLQNKHKSDIEVAIRNEGAQVQRGLENIVKENHFTLKTTLEQCFSDLSLKIVKQHKYSFIGFALMGINAILLLATLWFLRHQIF